MSNAFSLFRALVIYGICLPLAVFLGYLLSDPLNILNDGIVGLVLGLLSIPLFLRWHHPLLVLCWNMSAVMFFLPGRPMIFLPVCGISFFVSAIQYTLNKKFKFINVPAITWPLLVIAAVVIITAEFTGGMGLKVAGGVTYGGKRYIIVLSAIVGYFALTARRIEPESAPLYFKLYFLSVLSSGIGHLANILTPSLYFIFLVFPADMDALMAASTAPTDLIGSNVSRLGGLSAATSAACICMLGIYGIRGIFELRKPWRMGCFLLLGVVSLLGGFRSVLILLLLVFLVQFYLEGLLRSRLLPTLVLGGFLGAAIVVPFTDRLPLSVQRTLSFLPVKIDPVAAMDAKGSTEWRLNMWQRVLPEVPGHLLLGKGYSISAGEQVNFFQNTPGVDPFEGSLVAGDYHSGPLSLVMTFGIWGTAAFLWFLYAGTKVLYQNFLFGDLQFKKANTLLLAYFVAKIVFFFAIFGSFYTDLATFTGLLGLSVCINGGVMSPAPAPVVKQVFSKFKLAGATR